MDTTYKPPPSLTLVDPGAKGDLFTNTFATAKNQQLYINYRVALDKKLYDLQYQEMKDQQAVLAQIKSTLAAQAAQHDQSLFLLHVIAFGASFLVGMGFWRLVCYAKGQKNFW